MIKPIPRFVAVASAQPQPLRDVRARADFDADRMREQYVVDPVLGDTISCADLAVRERETWQQYDASWPGGIPAPGAPDRGVAVAAQRAARWRSKALQRVCRVERVRVG